MVAFPVGLSRDLSPGCVMHAQVEATDLAIWRDSQGRVNAWNNRCPHRGMSLSHGFVRRDRLTCLYHGWEYSASGQCEYIPAHPKLEPPKTICAEIYHAEDSDGLIWVSLDGAPAPVSQVQTTPLTTLVVSAPADVIAKATEQTPFEGASPVHSGSDVWQLPRHTIWFFYNNWRNGDTQLHVLVEQDVTGSDLKSVVRWCHAIRRRAEIMSKEIA